MFGILLLNTEKKLAMYYTADDTKEINYRGFMRECLESVTDYKEIKINMDELEQARDYFRVMKVNYLELFDVLGVPVKKLERMAEEEERKENK